MKLGIEPRILIAGFGRQTLKDRQELYPHLPRCSQCCEPMYKQFEADKRCGYCRAKNR